MRFASIQALRATAALLVAAHHLSDHRFVTGAAGVDIFFVVSGFVMGSVDTKVPPGQFILKRTIRIVPLYWATTLVLCAGALAGLFARFSFDGATLAKSLLFVPYYNAEGQIWPLAISGWTLNAEMLFYVLFAAGLWIGAPRTFCAAALAGLVIAGAIFAPENAPLRFWTSAIMLEFIAGLALAGPLRLAGLGRGLSLIAVGATGLVAAELAWHYTETLRPLVWGGPAFLIVCGALAIERTGRWPRRALAALERIGDAPYSLYLTHGFVIALVHRKVGTSVAANAMAVPACLALAFLTYYGFERPVGRMLNRLARPHARRALELAATSTR